jgi:hypothetical protein
MRGPFRPTLLLLALGGAGTSMIRGVLLPLRGTSTTMGAGDRGALVLGARLMLRARDGATDILLPLLLPLMVKLEDALDGDDGT